MNRRLLILSLIIFFSGYWLSFCRAEDDIPDWVKRINFSAQWETNKHPTVYFETVQPFYQSDDKVYTVFYQPRVSISADDFTYNLGVGYRKLTSEDMLLGINLFGDYEDLHEHCRVGIGGELLTQIVEARLNTYFGITTKRAVEEEDNAITIYEEVADGVDYELGAPLPYLPWLKLYTSGFWYNFVQADSTDKIGWKARLEAKPTEALTLEFYTWDDSKGSQEYGGKAECRLAFDSLADFVDIFEPAFEAFPKKDLRKATLVPVERDFDIVVEKWSDNSGFIIEIGRAP